MCKFCEPTEFEKKTFYNWSDYDPYEDEEQTDYIPDWEGVDFILDGKQFIISCSFDSGYIGDSIEITFNYCPICGKKI